MDDRFADPPTPTMAQGSIFQNPTTANTAGTTTRPGPLKPRPSNSGSLASIMSGPRWPVDPNSEDAKYLTLMSKIENLEAGNRLILDDIARLSHQVAKLTEMVNMPHGSRPSVIESPKGSFSKSMHKPKVPGTKVEIPEAEDSSPPKIIIPRTTKVARVEIQFGSPDQEAKERDPKSSHVSSANAALTLPGSTPTKPDPVLQPAEHTFESSDNIASSSKQYHQVEESVPRRSGESTSPSLSSEDSESVEQDEADGASRSVVQQLADNDVLFTFFVHYLTNPNTNLDRQVTTVRDETTRKLAASFRNAVTQPGRKQAIAHPESSHIRKAVGVMDESARVDLYMALSHRYRKEYGSKK